MTLEEAIIRYKDLAELDYGLAESYHTDEGVYLEQETKCRERAENYEQLAEWLKELKGLREDENVKEVFKNCDTCKYESLPPDDYPCDRCSHRYINQYVYDDKREVNADEDDDTCVD